MNVVGVGQKVVNSDHTVGFSEEEGGPEVIGAAEEIAEVLP